MERIVNLHIERLPEGVWLATSDELPGSVAQGTHGRRDTGSRPRRCPQADRGTRRATGGARAHRNRRGVRLSARRERLTGRPAGFRYRAIVRRLKLFGFAFDRHAAGSHEIWYNPETQRYKTVPNHPGDMPEDTPQAILRQAGIDPDEFLKRR